MSTWGRSFGAADLVGSGGQVETNGIRRHSGVCSRGARAIGEDLEDVIRLGIRSDGSGWHDWNRDRCDYLLAQE